MDVNNLPKVVTRQRGVRGSNSRPLGHQSDVLATRLDKNKNGYILWIDPENISVLVFGFTICLIVDHLCTTQFSHFAFLGLCLSRTGRVAGWSVVVTWSPAVRLTECGSPVKFDAVFMFSPPTASRSQSTESTETALEVVVIIVVGRQLSEQSAYVMLLTFFSFFLITPILVSKKCQSQMWGNRWMYMYVAYSACFMGGVVIFYLFI